MRARFAICLGVFAAIAMPVHAQTGGAPPAVAAKPAAPSAADLAFARNLALIRAHLLTGDELVALRQWDAAAMHFSFPREEIYGLIRDDLRANKIAAFDGALRALTGTVKAGNAKQFPKARQSIEALLDAAEANVKARQASAPRFTMLVAMAVLKAAPDEYDDAVAKGRVVRPIGYQTARGFVLQAERMVESVAGGFAAEKAPAVAGIRAGFAEIKAAQPSATAPKQATIDDATFQSLVGKIDAAAAVLLQ